MRRLMMAKARGFLLVAAVAAAILTVACGRTPAAPSDAAGTSSPSQTDEAVGGSEDPSSPSQTPSTDIVSGGLAGSDRPAIESTPAPASPEADQAYVPESSIDTENKRLNVTVNGETVYVKNGGQVILRDGLAIEIFVDPYPPSALRSWMDFYLTKDGEPVTDASMGIEYDMLAMVHGPFWGEAEKLGNGHYLFTLDYIMFGAWDQTVTVRIGLERIKLPVLLVAYP